MNKESPSLETLWQKLPVRVRMELETLERAMEHMATARKKSSAARDLAGTTHALGLSAQRLRTLFYKWLNSGKGILPLINHNKCGGCGLPGCGTEQEAAIPAELLEEWRRRAGSNDKRAFTQAWRTVIADLQAGKSLPGLSASPHLPVSASSSGTWLDLYAQLHPARELPEKCPWSLHRPPPGWSQANFQRQRQSSAQYDLQKKGFFAATKHLPAVRMNLADLRPLEHVVFDDHRLDFKVIVKDARGRSQVVELWGLFAMDVATRSVIAFGLRPRIIREDGTAEGFTRRDMQHLIAGMLLKFGYPKNFTMTLIVENAAAAVSNDTEALLARISRGQIVVRRTGVGCGDLTLRGFPERWGNPRGKSWLESWFNPLDIVLGSVKGQSGSSYAVKPGDHDARIMAAKKMLRIIDALPDRERERLLSPFEHSTDALQLVHQAIQFLNARTDHDLLGFDTVREWRWSASDPTWKPMLLSDAAPDVRGDVAEFLNLEASARERIIALHSNARPESPMERWSRLHRATDYQAVTNAIYADLYLDTKEVEYKGGDVIDLTMARGARAALTMRYRGEDHRLTPGDKVICRFDSDKPDAGVWFTDAAGRYLGTMRADASVDNRERLQRDLGARSKAHAALVQEVRNRLGRPEDLAEEIALTEQSIEVLQSFTPPAITAGPEDKSSVFLVEQIQKPQRKPQRHKPRTGGAIAPPPAREAFSFESTD